MSRSSNKYARQRRILSELASTFKTAKADGHEGASCEYGSGLPYRCNDLSFSFYEGKHWCVLHYPGADKQIAFEAAIKRRLLREDYDFRGVWFCSTEALTRHRFTKDLTFRHAVFAGKVDFSYLEFTGTADFGSVVFHQDVSFHAAAFLKDVSFRGVLFKRAVDFSFAKFGGYARFVGDSEHRMFTTECSLDLRFVRVERPDRISFHSVSLRPEWFVNVDARRFELTDIAWERNLKREIDSLRASMRRQWPHALLSIAYRQLAVNSEENHRYFEAAEFRYCSMEILRWRNRYVDGVKQFYLSAAPALLGKAVRERQLWPIPRAISFANQLLRTANRERRNRRNRALLTLTWWYWLMSGYSERAIRAAGSLTIIIIIFALLYAASGTIPQSGGSRLHKLLSAAEYSFEVVLLQKPEPRPSDVLQHFLVGAETALGPLQAALLALAVRRRFMR